MRLRWSRLVLGLLAAVVAAAGCQVRTTVTVDVEQDGSGRVEVVVGLDEEAMDQLPDLDNSGAGDPADLTQMVRADDLRAAGWVLTAPESGDDGFTVIRASKPFGTPEEAGEILAELTGPNGPLQGLTVTRSESFGRSRYGFAGTADLSGGLEAFGDEGLAAALDGEPLGEDAAVIEQRLGRPLAEMVTLEIDANLPGGSSSWSPVLGGESVEMDASSTVYDWPVLALAAVAVACFLAPVAVIGVRWRRGRAGTR